AHSLTSHSQLLQTGYRLCDEILGCNRWTHAEHVSSKARRLPSLSRRFSLTNQRSPTDGHQDKTLNRRRTKTQHKDRIGRIANILMIRQQERAKAVLLHRLLQPFEPLFRQSFHIDAEER